MAFDPKWDERLYEITRMPVITVNVGGDLVKAHSDGSSIIYVLREDWTPPMLDLVEHSQTPNAEYITLEKENAEPRTAVN